MKITLYREKMLSPCKRMWGIWNKMGRQKLQFVFKPLKIHSSPSPQFSLSGWAESPLSVCALWNPFKNSSQHTSLFFLFTFFCMESAGLLLTVLCWQGSQERLWVADSCWNKSLPLWGEKEIHSTFPVSLFPSTLTSFFLLHSFHNNSLVHWMQTGGMFFHI